MRVPLNVPDLGELEEKFVLDALRSGWVGASGPYIDRLEEGFRRLTGRRHAVACSSGTAALWLALRGLTWGQGHRYTVVVQSYSCDALANAPLNVTGRPPAILPVEDETWSLSALPLSRWLDKLSNHGDVCVILAHTYGVPARDTEEIAALCRRLGIPLIEDASEAHGATIGGRPVGSFGEVSVFSCRSEKLVSGGQLGILTTDDGDIARRARQWGESGLPAHSVRYWSSVPGLNFQPSHLNAALACAQLARLPELVEARRRRHEGWHQRLEKIPGLRLQDDPSGGAVWWLTAVEIGPEFSSIRASDLALALADVGVDTRPGFYPLYFLPHAAAGQVEPCPVSERLLERLLILPSGAGVGEAEQDYVVQEMLRIAGRGL